MSAVQWFYLMGSPPALVMPFYYHFTNKWYTSKEGRLFMLMMLLPFGLYTSILIFFLVDSGWVRDAIRYSLVFLASLGSWSTLVVYHLIRRESLSARPARGHEQARE